MKQNICNLRRSGQKKARALEKTAKVVLASGLCEMGGHADDTNDECR